MSSYRAPKCSRLIGWLSPPGPPASKSWSGPARRLPTLSLRAFRPQAGSWSSPVLGITAATDLSRRGCWQAAVIVRVLVVGEAERIKGDAALAAKRWGGPLAPADPEGLAAAGDAFDLVIDALFGAGLDRPVDGLPRGMIESMNAQPAPILAVDLPSGINGTWARSWGLPSKPLGP